jgi:hypothetical protein
VLLITFQIFVFIVLPLLTHRLSRD